MSERAELDRVVEEQADIIDSIAHTLSGLSNAMYRLGMDMPGEELEMCSKALSKSSDILNKNLNHRLSYEVNKSGEQIGQIFKGMLQGIGEAGKENV